MEGELLGLEEQGLRICWLSAAVILDNLHPALRVVYVIFMTAGIPQAFRGMTANISARGSGAPSTHRARLDAFFTVEG